MGIDTRLLELLATNVPIPTTYAGGVASFDDLERIRLSGKGRILAYIFIQSKTEQCYLSLESSDFFVDHSKSLQ